MEDKVLFLSAYYYIALGGAILVEKLNKIIFPC